MRVHGERNLTGRLAELQMCLPPESLRFGGTVYGSICVPIASDTRDRLRAQKVGNETYSDVIERLIDEEDTDE